MNKSIVFAALTAAALLFAGCAQGPGHTRAAGAGVGAATGAFLGAAAGGPHHRGSGAAVGAVLGLVTGSMVGEGIAQDQERCCPPPCPPPCGPTRIIRRRYVRPDGTVIREEEIIEEDVIVERR